MTGTVENIAVLQLVGGQYVVGVYQEIPTPDGQGVCIVLHKPMEMQIMPGQEGMRLVMHPFGSFYGSIKPQKTVVFPNSSFYTRTMLEPNDPMYTKYQEYSQNL